MIEVNRKQMEIIQHLSKGLTNKQIALELGQNPNGITHHLRKISKLIGKEDIDKVAICLAYMEGAFRVRTFKYEGGF